MKKTLQFSISTFLIIGILIGSGFILKPSIVNDYQVWVVIMAITAMLSSQPPISKRDLFNPKDKYSMLGILLMGILVHNIAITQWALKPKQNDSLITFQIMGFLMIWGGLIFRIYAIHELSVNFNNTVDIPAERKLNQVGIYSLIRHPSYTGAITSMIGTVIWLESWNFLILCVGLISIAYWHRIRQEERILTDYFGETYKEYCKKTGSLFPKIGLKLFIIKKVPKKMT